jgi:ribosome-binding factor A
MASAMGYVRHELGRRLRLKRMPELIFILDRGLEESERVERLLHDLKDEH